MFGLCLYCLGLVLVSGALRVISSGFVSESFVRRVFKVAVGFVVGALVLLAGSLYLSTYYMEQGQRLSSAGNVEGALDSARIAARFNPFYSMPLVMESALFQRQGQNQAAEAAIAEAVERDPANYTNKVYQANLLATRLNQPEKAVEIYEEALKQNPRDTGLIFILAQARTREGDLEGAREAYEKLVQFNKIPPRGLYNLGKIYVRTGAPEKGVETLQEAKKRVSANLERAAGAKRAEREAFVRSVDLALVDALVVEGRDDEARSALRASDSEQAPAILELLNMDPEGYRETVLRSEV